LGQRFTNYTQERAARERAETLRRQTETENARLKALLRQANIIDPDDLA
jgi:hypothetical protein